jgi:L-asparagine transporter-like permease
MIFVTHLFFRTRWVRQGNKPLAFRMWGFPVLTLLGAALMLAALVSTLFTDVFRLTVLTGLPFLLLLSAVYAIWYRKPAGQPVPQANTPTQAQAR